jgi:cobalamin-dependent methionine synthase I
MLIIGEKINTVRKSIVKAYYDKDSKCIRDEAIRQAKAGADVIDINAGISIDIDPGNMAWAVKTVQDAVDIPLCIDSPDPATIRAGFEACKDKKSAWANSITLERKRIEGILPLVKEYKCTVVALCMGKESFPKTARERIEVAKKLVDVVDSFDIPVENIYLDPLIEPISVQTDRGLVSLETVRGLKSELPGIKLVICLSAISFGLPERKLINRVYLPFLLYEGVDAIILDPMDKELMKSVKAAEVLLNRDEFCSKYLTAYREGKL